VNEPEIRMKENEMMVYTRIGIVVFAILPDLCPKLGGKTRIISFIEKKIIRSFVQPDGNFSPVPGKLEFLGPGPAILGNRDLVVPEETSAAMCSVTA
jgi:hypothetical protein